MPRLNMHCKREQPRSQAAGFTRVHFMVLHKRCIVVVGHEAKPNSLGREVGTHGCGKRLNRGRLALAKANLRFHYATFLSIFKVIKPMMTGTKIAVAIGLRVKTSIACLFLGLAMWEDVRQNVDHKDGPDCRDVVRDMYRNECHFALLPLRPPPGLGPACRIKEPG
jgi:hypothetical protein